MAGLNSGVTDYDRTNDPTPQTPNTTTNRSPNNAENGTNPLTGFAKASGYTPAMLPQLYENPWYVLPDVFKGIKTSSPGYQALRDIGADPLSLYNIMVGSQRTANQDTGANDFTNFLGELYKNLGTPGGRSFDAGELLSAIFGQKKTGADAKTTLGQILGSGDMSTQVRTLYNLLRDVSNVSMNPLAARGYQSSLAQAGDTFANSQLKSDAGSTLSPTDWIRKNMPWLT